MLVPGAIGIGLCNATLSALISKSAGRTSRGACRAPPARSRVSAGRSARSGATARCRSSAKGPRTDPRRCVLVGAAALTTQHHQPTETDSVRDGRSEDARHQPSAARSRDVSSVQSGRNRRQLSLQPRDQIVELIDDRADRVRLAQIDAGLLQQRHRIVAAARLQQRQVAVARRGAVCLAPVHDLLHQLRR